MLWLYGAGTALGSKSYGRGTERADHEAVALEGLVHRRRLVDAADDRLEVVDVEDPGIEVAVPADHVERMVVEHQLVDRVVLLDQEREIALLVVRPELQRTPDVALGVGRAFEQLAELVAVALGEADVPAALEDQELGRAAGEIQPPAMQDVAVDARRSRPAGTAGRRRPISRMPFPSTT